MSQVSEIIKNKIALRGGNKSEIARLLGVSSQLLGQYARGRHKPKPEFYIRWKDVFGEDLISETNVSHETKGSQNMNSILMTEGRSELDLLNVVLLSHKELLAEKEARRQEAEARLKKEEDRYDKLFILLESNLKELYDRTLDIITAQHVGAAYQMFWIDRWAEKEAGGDKEKAERLVKAYRTAVVDKLKGKKEKSTP